MAAVMDESANMRDTMQHAVLVHGLDMEFNVAMEIVWLVSPTREHNGSQVHNIPLLDAPRISVSKARQGD
jgi:hypothetical protein